MALGLATALLGGGVGATPSAWASAGGKNAQVKDTVHHPAPYRCVLELGSVHRRHTTGGDGDGDGDTDDSPPTSRPPEPGIVVVDIPAVVIARAHGRRLVVSTNTGSAPNRSEPVYLVSKSQGGLAPESIRELVLSECKARSGH